MRRNWTLKARALEGKIRLTLVDEEGRLLFKDRNALFTAYFLPRGLSPFRLRDLLYEIPWIEDVFLEEWLSPPWYREHRAVVKILVREPGKIQAVASILEGRGIAEQVNIQPSPLSLALKEIRISLMSWEGCSDEALEMNPPPLRIARVKPEDSGWKIILEELEGGKTESFYTADRNELEECLGRSHIVDASGCGNDCMFLRDIMQDRIVIYERKLPVKSIPGLMELSRISYMNMEEVALSSIGRILTEIEALQAVEDKLIVPKVRVMKGYWRSLSDMIELDRGGLIGSPRPGLYENVIELDFSSLYPSIIAKNNISPETIEDPLCVRPFRPSGSPYDICMDREGLVSRVASRLVDRREALRSSETSWSRERQEAIKWILVSSFGYLGYRNSRFGNLKAYETVTSIARETIRKAINTAIESGYDVIHYIVDSLFLKPGRKSVTLETLVQRIEGRTGFRVKLEAVFKWLIIPPVQYSEAHGASNRYYGLTVNNRLIIKGARCFDNPPLISQGEEERILRLLLNHRHPRSLCSALVYIIGKKEQNYIAGSIPKSDYKTIIP